MKCLICNSLNKTSKIKFSYLYKDLKYYECMYCNFVFQSPIPSKEEFKNMYDKEYFESNYKMNNKLYNFRKIQYTEDKKLILKHFRDSKEKKVLDYGCGNGNFLKLFNSQKYGYEFNQKAKISKQVKRLNEKEVFKKKYDLIIMRGVIEHVPNIRLILKKLSKCSKKGSLFYITATPNIYNLTFFLSNKSFNQNHSAHIFHFNNVNLSLLFLQNNFLNIETNYQYANTPYANFKKDFWNLKKQLTKYNKNSLSKSPASSGNMMSVIFRKMI